MNWSSRPTSKNKEWLREVQKETGEKFKTLEDEPELNRHLFWVWKAFTDLNGRRPMAGMGTCMPISYTEIDAYFRLKDITFPAEKERLLYLLDQLDREWMRQYVEKEENKTTAPRIAPTVPKHHNPPRGGGTKVPPRREV